MPEMRQTVQGDRGLSLTLGFGCKHLPPPPMGQSGAGSKSLGEVEAAGSVQRGPQLLSVHKPELTGLPGVGLPAVAAVDKAICPPLPWPR